MFKKKEDPMDFEDFDDDEFFENFEKSLGGDMGEDPADRQGIRGFFKNFVKSSGRGVTRIGKLFMPQAHETVEGLKNAFSDTKDNLDTFKQKMMKELSIKTSDEPLSKEIANKLKAGKEDLITRLKTGNFIKPEKGSDLSDFMNDDDDDSSSDDDDEWGDSYQQEEKKEEFMSDANTDQFQATKAPEDSSKKRPLKKVFNKKIFANTTAGAEVSARATFAATEASISSQEKLFKKTEIMAETRHRHKMNLMKNMAQNLYSLTASNAMLAKIQLEYGRKSLAMMADNLALVKEMHQYQTKIYGDALKQKEANADMRSSAADIFGNGFDGYGYAERLKENFLNMFQDSVLGQAYDSMGMLKEMPGAKKNQGLLGAALSGFSPENALLKLFVTADGKKNFGYANKAFASLPALINQKLLAMAKGGGIAGTIAGLLGIKDTQGSLDFTAKGSSRDPKAPAIFDNRTWITLNEVIPGFLSRIDAGINGNEQVYYDHKSMQFKTVSSMERQYKRELDQMYDSDFEASEYMQEMVADATLEASRRGLENITVKDIAKNLRNIFKRVVDTGEQFIPSRALYDEDYFDEITKDIDGDDDFKRFFVKEFITSYSKMDKQAQIEFTLGIANTQSQVMQFKKMKTDEIADSGMAQYAREFDENNKKLVLEKEIKQLKNKLKSLPAENKAERVSLQNRLTRLYNELTMELQDNVGVINKVDSNGDEEWEDFQRMGGNQLGLMRQMVKILSRGIPVFPLLPEEEEKVRGELKLLSNYFIRDKNKQKEKRDRLREEEERIADERNKNQAQNRREKFKNMMEGRGAFGEMLGPDLKISALGDSKVGYGINMGAAFLADLAEGAISGILGFEQNKKSRTSDVLTKEMKQMEMFAQYMSDMKADENTNKVIKSLYDAIPDDEVSTGKKDRFGADKKRRLKKKEKIEKLINNLETKLVPDRNKYYADLFSIDPNNPDAIKKNVYAIHDHNKKIAQARKEVIEAFMDMGVLKKRKGRRGIDKDLTYKDLKDELEAQQITKELFESIVQNTYSQNGGTILGEDSLFTETDRSNINDIKEKIIPIYEEHGKDWYKSEKWLSIRKTAILQIYPGMTAEQYDNMNEQMKDELSLAFALKYIEEDMEYSDLKKKYAHQQDEEALQTLISVEEKVKKDTEWAKKREEVYWKEQKKIAKWKKETNKNKGEKEKKVTDADYKEYSEEYKKYFMSGSKDRNSNIFEKTGKKIGDFNRSVIDQGFFLLPRLRSYGRHDGTGLVIKLVADWDEARGLIQLCNKYRVTFDTNFNVPGDTNLVYISKKLLPDPTNPEPTGKDKDKFVDRLSNTLGHDNVLRITHLASIGKIRLFTNRDELWDFLRLGPDAEQKELVKKINANAGKRDLTDSEEAALTDEESLEALVGSSTPPDEKDKKTKKLKPEQIRRRMGFVEVVQATLAVKRTLMKGFAAMTNKDPNDFDDGNSGSLEQFVTESSIANIAMSGPQSANDEGYDKQIDEELTLLRSMDESLKLLTGGFFVSINGGSIGEFIKTAAQKGWDLTKWLAANGWEGLKAAGAGIAAGAQWLGGKAVQGFNFLKGTMDDKVLPWLAEMLMKWKGWGFLKQHLKPEQLDKLAAYAYGVDVNSEELKAMSEEEKIIAIQEFYKARAKEKSKKFWGRVKKVVTAPFRAIGSAFGFIKKWKNEKLDPFLYDLRQKLGENFLHLVPRQTLENIASQIMNVPAHDPQIKEMSDKELRELITTYFNDYIRDHISLKGIGNKLKQSFRDTIEFLKHPLSTAKKWKDEKLDPWLYEQAAKFGINFTDKMSTEQLNKIVARIFKLVPSDPQVTSLSDAEKREIIITYYRDNIKDIANKGLNFVKDSIDKVKRGFQKVVDFLSAPVENIKQWKNEKLDPWLAKMYQKLGLGFVKKLGREQLEKIAAHIYGVDKNDPQIKAMSDEELRETVWEYFKEHVKDKIDGAKNGLSRAGNALLKLGQGAWNMGVNVLDALTGGGIGRSKQVRQYLARITQYTRGTFESTMATAMLLAEYTEKSIDAAAAKAILAEADRAAEAEMDKPGKGFKLGSALKGAAKGLGNILGGAGKAIGALVGGAGRAAGAILRGAGRGAGALLRGGGHLLAGAGRGTAALLGAGARGLGALAGATGRGLQNAWANLGDIGDAITGNNMEYWILPDGTIVQAQKESRREKLEAKRAMQKQMKSSGSGNKADGFVASEHGEGIREGSRLDMLKDKEAAMNKKRQEEVHETILLISETLQEGNELQEDANALLKDQAKQTAAVGAGIGGLIAVFGGKLKGWWDKFTGKSRKSDGTYTKTGKKIQGIRHKLRNTKVGRGIRKAKAGVWKLKKKFGILGKTKGKLTGKLGKVGGKALKGLGIMTTAGAMGRIITGKGTGEDAAILASSAYDSIKNMGKGLGRGILTAGKKAAGAIGSLASKSWVKNAAKIGGKALKTVGKAALSIGDKLIKVISWLLGKFFKNSAIAKRVGAQGASSITKSIINAVKKCGAKVIGKVAAKAGAVLGMVSTGVGAIPALAWKVADATIGFFNGMKNAKQFWGLGGTTKLTAGMKIATGLVGAIDGLLWGLLSISGMFLGSGPTSGLGYWIQLFYKLLGGNMDNVEAAQNFARERSKVYGIDDTELFIKFESTWIKFAGRMAKLLKFKTKKCYEYWYNKRYKPLKDIEETLMNKYGGKKVVGTVGPVGQGEEEEDGSDADKRNKFQKEFILLAKKFIQQNNLGSINPSMTEEQMKAHEQGKVDQPDATDANKISENADENSDDPTNTTSNNTTTDDGKKVSWWDRLWGKKADDNTKTSSLNASDTADLRVNTSQNVDPKLRERSIGQGQQVKELPQVLKTAQGRIALVLKNEGGYVNHPSDPGGVTNFGIAYNKNKDRLKKYGIMSPADMRNLTKDQAIAFYYEYYYKPIGVDNISDPVIAMHYFDVAVNSGPGRAKEFLTEAKKSSNPRDCFIQLRYNYYRAITRKNPKFNDFLRGWLNRIKHVNDALGYQYTEGSFVEGASSSNPAPDAGNPTGPNPNAAATESVSKAAMNTAAMETLSGSDVQKMANNNSAGGGTADSDEMSNMSGNSINPSKSTGNTATLKKGAAQTFEEYIHEELKLLNALIEGQKQQTQAIVNPLIALQATMQQAVELLAQIAQQGAATSSIGGMTNQIASGI